MVLAEKGLHGVSVVVRENLRELVGTGKGWPNASAAAFGVETLWPEAALLALC
jgi:hypothetical protein